MGDEAGLAMPTTRAAGRLVDATQGRKTRSILVTDSNHVILSSIQPETISQRFAQEDA